LRLDRIEGCPDHYNRVSLKVEDDEKHEVEAEVYIANPDKIRNGLKPRREYMKYLLEAQDVLSENYYKKLGAFQTVDSQIKKEYC
jgi:uncharacterized protein (DUF1499 family)